MPQASSLLALLPGQALAWLLTYALHSTLLLALAWVVSRRLGGRWLRLEEIVWRCALVGGLLTATVQSAVGHYGAVLPGSRWALVPPTPPACAVAPSPGAGGARAGVVAASGAGTSSEPHRVVGVPMSGQNTVVLAGGEPGIGAAPAATEAVGTNGPRAAGPIGAVTDAVIRSGAESADGRGTAASASSARAEDCDRATLATAAGNRRGTGLVGTPGVVAQRVDTSSGVWRNGGAAAAVAASTAAALRRALAVAAWPTVALWLCGALLLTAFYARSYLLLRRRLRYRPQVVGGGVVRRLAALARAAGLSRRVRLTCTWRLRIPVALGTGAGEVCVPPRALFQLSEEQQDAMLAHELAHLARRDPLWLLTLHLIVSVFFFQPLNWIARRRLRDLSELLADEWAVAQTGRPLSLAGCLAEVAGWALLAGPPAGPRADRMRSLAVPGMADRPSQLAHRIRRLLEPKPTQGNPSLPGVAILLATILVAVALAAPGVSADSGTAPTAVLTSAGAASPAIDAGAAHSGSPAGEIGLLSASGSGGMRGSGAMRDPGIADGSDRTVDPAVAFDSDGGSKAVGASGPRDTAGSTRVGATARETGRSSAAVSTGPIPSAGRLDSAGVAAAASIRPPLAIRCDPQAPVLAPFAVERRAFEARLPSGRQLTVYAVFRDDRGGSDGAKATAIHLSSPDAYAVTAAVDPASAASSASAAPATAAAAPPAPGTAAAPDPKASPKARRRKLASLPEAEARLAEVDARLAALDHMSAMSEEQIDEMAATVDRMMQHIDVDLQKDLKDLTRRATESAAGAPAPLSARDLADLDAQLAALTARIQPSAKDMAALQASLRKLAAAPPQMSAADIQRLRDEVERSTHQLAASGLSPADIEKIRTQARESIAAAAAPVLSAAERDKLIADAHRLAEQTRPDAAQLKALHDLAKHHEDLVRTLDKERAELETMRREIEQQAQSFRDLARRQADDSRRSVPPPPQLSSPPPSHP